VNTSEMMEYGGLLALLLAALTIAVVVGLQFI
jgi:hypothetical protein